MRQDHPAVLILGHFSPQAQREHGFAGQDHWHNVVAQFYDTPHIRYGPFPYPHLILVRLYSAGRPWGKN